MVLNQSEHLPQQTRRRQETANTYDVHDPRCYRAVRANSRPLQLPFPGGIAVGAGEYAAVSRGSPSPLANGPEVRVTHAS